MTPSKEELLAIARQYWRPDKDMEDDSPENLRFQAAWRKGLARMDEWWAFIEQLQPELPDLELGNITATCDASFKVGAYAAHLRRDKLSPWVIVGCMSVLAPVYIIYGVRFELAGRKRTREEVLINDLPAEMRGPAELMARRMEERFEVSAVPPDIAATPIPLFVEWREPPETTLLHALFTSEPSRIP